MYTDNNQQAFFELLRAGLWEKDAWFSQFKDIDYDAILGLAEEQSVTGLVAAGIEVITNHTDGTNINIPQEWRLQFIGSALQIEQQNKDMNVFLARLIEKLRKEDVFAILVKGQGVAQCYKRPLWRSCGDIDLLLSNENYVAAKSILSPIASSIDKENKKRKHLALTIDDWTVELHGTLRTNLWNNLERVMDEVQGDVFCGGNVRSWMNGKTQVFLLRVDEDVVFVFAHILQHFFIEGIGLRQICDWCRLLWCYRSELDLQLLESRLRKAEMMREWKVFAAFAVDYLGMPVEAMPFYDAAGCWKRKAKTVLTLVMEAGNFGQGKDKSYKERCSTVIRYAISFGRHAKDGYRRFCLFPADALLMWWKLMMHGMRGVLHISRTDAGL